MKKLPIFALALCLFTSVQLVAQDGGKKSYDLSGFNAIALATSADVHIKKGDFKVEVDGPADALKRLEVSVNGSTLAIASGKKGKYNYKNGNSGSVDIYITMPSIREISMSGSGDIMVKDRFENQGDLDINLSGSGDIMMQGSAKMVKVSVAGSGDIDAANLNAASYEVSIAGSGDVSVGTSRSLDVAIAGSGDVSYKGEPKISKSIVGSGDLNKM